jgi:lysophospholipase L1-like esterase
MRRATFTTVAPVPAILLLLAACYALAQDAPDALLGRIETRSTATRAVQLMESTAVAVPGLTAASEQLRKNTQETVDALEKAFRDPPLTLRLTNEIKAYLALADALPRPDFFPAAASQQFLELRDDLQRFDRHFNALLAKEQADARTREADPNDLKHYALLDSRLPAPTATSLPRYVFIGDSATEAWRMNEYFTSQDFVNRGIAGQTTTQVLARFPADVLALHPVAAIVLAGSGDVAAGIPTSAITDNLTMMADVAKAHSVRPVFASLLPSGGEAAAALTPDAIRKVNAWLRDYCAREKFIYIDYYAAMADENGMMKADLSDDGVNPNSKGYRVMSPILLDGIERLRAAIAAQDEPAKPKRRLLPLIQK